MSPEPRQDDRNDLALWLAGLARNRPPEEQIEFVHVTCGADDDLASVVLETLQEGGDKRLPPIDRERLAGWIAGEARMRPEGERRAFVESACQGDEPLAAIVLQQLEAGDDVEATEELTTSGSGSRSSPLLDGRLDADWLRSRTDEGHWVGGYRILRLIASGGMGEVYEAEQPSLERSVALKLGRGTRNVAASSMRRFLREARIHGRLEHPNIVPVHELAADDQGRPFFTMKVVRGRTLAQALSETLASLKQGNDGGSFRLRERLDVFRKVCDAISYAHSQGIIHRDLKPDNVMLGEFGEVQVMDWGLARVAHEDSGRDERRVDDHVDGMRAAPPNEEAEPDTETRGLTSASTPGSYLDTPTLEGSILGTPAYMSPEQAAGEVTRLGFATDIYSLGAVLYTLLTYLAPIEKRGVQEMLQRVKAGDFEPPTERVVSAEPLDGVPLRVPPELEAICLKAMATKPEARYASVLELRRDVDRYLDGQFVEATSYSSWQRVAKWTRRHRARLMPLAALAVVTTIVALVAWRAVQRQRLEQIEDAVSPTRVALASLHQDLQSVHALPHDRTGHPRALRQLASLEATRAEVAQVAADNPLVVEHRSGWIEELAQLERVLPEVEETRLGEWLSELRHRAPNLERGEFSSEIAVELERDFGALREFATVARRGNVPIADIPLGLARRAAAEALEAETRLFLSDGSDAVERLQVLEQAEARVVRHALDAWRTQPDSSSTAHAFLLLCELGARRSASPADFRDVARRYQMASSLFATERDEIAVRCLLGYARSLAVLHPREALATSPPTTAGTMALRCLLELLEPGGKARAWTTQALTELDDADRDALLEEARDLLEILRITTRRRPMSAEWHLSHRFPGRFLRFGRRPIDVEVGLLDREKLQIETVRSVTFASSAPDQSARISVVRLPARPGSAELLYASEGRITLVDDALSGEGRLALELDWMPQDAAHADVDGDGLPDLVLIRGYAADDGSSLMLHVAFGRPDQGFEPPVRFGVPIPAEEARWRGTRALRTAELDGRPGDEIILCRGILLKFDTEIIQCGEDRILTSLGTLPFGTSIPLVISGDRTADGRELTLISPIADALNDYSLLGGRPYIETLPRLVTVRENRPWLLPAARSPTPRWSSMSRNSGALGMERDRFALTSFGFRRGEQPAAVGCWAVYRGPLSAESRPRTHLVQAPAQHLVDDAYLVARTAEGRFDLARRISDESLLELAERPLPVSRLRARPPTTPIDRARVLLSLGYPRQAAGLLQATTSEPSVEDSAARLALLVRALRASEDGLALRTLIRELEPADDLVTPFLEACEAYFETSTRFEDLVDPLQRWASSPGLSSEQLGLVRQRLVPLRRTEGTLASTTTEVVGDALRDGRGPSRDLFVASDPFLPLPRGEAPWLISARRPEGSERSRGEPQLLRRNSATAWEVRELPRLAGVLVQVEEGAASVELEFEVCGVHAHSWIHLELLAPDAQPKPDGKNALFTLRGSESPALSRATVNGSVRLETLLGRRLRYRIDFLPELGRLRRTVADADSGQVIKAWLSPARELPARGPAILGFVSESPHDQQLLVHRLTLRGALKLSGSTAGRDWPRALFSRIARPSSAAIKAQELEELARHQLDAATQLTPRKQQKLLRSRAALNLLEAAWARHERTGFGDALWDLLLWDEVSPADVRTWAMRKAVGDDRLDAWAALGEALPELPDDHALANVQRVGSCLASCDLSPPGIARCLGTIVQLEEDSEPAFWLLDVLGAHERPRELPDEIRHAYLIALRRLNARPRLLETARPGDEAVLGWRHAPPLEVAQVLGARLARKVWSLTDSAHRRGQNAGE